MLHGPLNVNFDSVSVLTIISETYQLTYRKNGAPILYNLCSLQVKSNIRTLRL
jgi:hypothetical protein